MKLREDDSGSQLFETVICELDSYLWPRNDRLGDDWGGLMTNYRLNKPYCFQKFYYGVVYELACLVWCVVTIILFFFNPESGQDNKVVDFIMW